MLFEERKRFTPHAIPPPGVNRRLENINESSSSSVCCGYRIIGVSFSCSRSSRPKGCRSSNRNDLKVVVVS